MNSVSLTARQEEKNMRKPRDLGNKNVMFGIDYSNKVLKACAANNEWRHRASRMEKKIIKYDGAVKRPTDGR